MMVARNLKRPPAHRRLIEGPTSDASPGHIVLGPERSTAMSTSSGGRDAACPGGSGKPTNEGKCKGGRSPLVGGDRLGMLSAVALFAGIPRARLRELTSWFDEIALEAGRVLMQKDRHQSAFYVLICGRVSIEDEHGQPETLGPGSWLGGQSMLDRVPAAARAVTRTPCRFLVMGHAQFRALKSHPELVRRLAGCGW